MGKVGSTVTAIFAAIITLAIISVIISRRSRAPEAIQAVATGLANVVRAAVAPGSAQTNGNGAQAYSTPSTYA